MRQELQDRVIVVTGATGALGTSVCKELVAAGARVHATYVQEREVARFREALGAAAGHCTMHDTNLVDEASVRALFAELDSAEVRRVDGLVCVAGGFAMDAFEKTTLAGLRAQLDLNVVSAFLCMREAVSRMKTARRGRIVTIGSRAAVEHPGGMSAYVASKAALVAMTQSVAAETKHDGISCATLLPSTIDTPANRASMPDADHSKWVAPERIAKVVRWLCGDDALVASGAVIPVYGEA